jgi:hypothetical protein
VSLTHSVGVTKGDRQAGRERYGVGMLGETEPRRGLLGFSRKGSALMGMEGGVRVIEISVSGALWRFFSSVRGADTGGNGNRQVAVARVVIV